MSEDYQGINLALWDQRGIAHAASPGYNVAAFRDDPQHLSDVVRFDRPLLGDIAGLTGVHLQCHIGTDTLSLHRLGARMSGLDFSSTALAAARQLAADTAAEIDYRQGDLYDAATVFAPGSFARVYTGIGAICWLPDIARWATIVAALLKPGGRLFLREFHPVLWALEDPRPDGLLVLRYPYFETPEPDVFDVDGTYVPTDYQFTATREATWNHGLGEIVQALLDAGLTVTGLVEQRSTPENQRGDEMRLGDDGEYHLVEHAERLPITYTLQAAKR